MHKGVRATYVYAGASYDTAERAATYADISAIAFGSYASYQSLNSGVWKINKAAEAAEKELTVYETALAGGKHSGFLKNYLGRNADEINKAMKSMQSGKEGINVHLDKLANPTKYVPNWNTLRPGHQQSLIKGWQNTVTKHNEQIEILRGILGN